MIRRLAAQARAQWAGLLALFLVLTGGTAMAVDGSLPGQNTVGSSDIINGEVTSDDLKADSIGGAKIASQSVKNSDLGLGASSSNTIADNGVKGVDVDESSLSGGAIPGTTARAYGHVAANGTVTIDKNVVGNATDHNGVAPTQGIYCIQLDPSIDANQAVIVPETDYVGDGTSTPLARIGWAKGVGDGNICNDGNAVQVITGVIVGDGSDDNAGGDSITVENQPFYFIVP